MVDLLAGNRAEMPRFNFKTGLREYKGDYLQLGPEDILVIEGIHGLNDQLSHSLPLKSKYKIYISALTSLNVDDHNRIATTDGRLIRRMVRDARTRGASATHTLRMWASVRRGEEENIFPFQESADAMFNSALLYELAVLKQFAAVSYTHLFRTSSEAGTDALSEDPGPSPERLPGAVRGASPEAGVQKGRNGYSSVSAYRRQNQGRGAGTFQIRPLYYGGCMCPASGK